VSGIYKTNTLSWFCIVPSYWIYKLLTLTSLVKKELLTLPGHLSSLPVFNGVCVARSLAFWSVFVDRCFSSSLTIDLSVLRFTDSDIHNTVHKLYYALIFSFSKLILHVYIHHVCVSDPIYTVASSNPAQSRCTGYNIMW
jgi:hypothetical protein